jgi:hypothetical protein
LRVSSLRSLILVAYVATSAVGVTAQVGQIVPGESVAGVRIGDTFREFAHVFPPQPRFDEEFPGNACLERSYHWVDIKADATGVYAYFKGGQVSQMSVQTPRFHLGSGLKTGATVQQVLQAFPRGRWSVLLHSGSTEVGGKDLTYWVDSDSGVAFSFYWDRRKKERLVFGIDIFQKSTNYLPEGCISSPQQWRELEQTSSSISRQ